MLALLSVAVSLSLFVALPRSIQARDTAKRSVAEIRKTLAGIMKGRTGRSVKGQQAAALKQLKAYRYLAGVPYEHLKLDESLNDYAKAAAMLCRKLGRLEHNPSKNPGLPEAAFEKGRKGTRNCNLASMFGRKQTLPGTVIRYMDDSDPRNIRGLGHRRWCLNPTMGQTGFGSVPGYSAMWAMDTSHKAPEFDYIAWPPAGFMPVSYFGVKHAWHVSLNPKKYARPDGGVKAQIYAVDRRGKRDKTPLPLSDTYISVFPYGVSYCVIFRPTARSLTGKRKLAVVIEGLKDREGKPAKVEYSVEFVRLK